MNRRKIIAWKVLAAVVVAAGTSGVRADTIDFDNSCGDTFWHSCCGPAEGVKSNNWNVAESPAPLCPALPTAADDVNIAGDCAIQAAMTGAAKNLVQTSGTFTVNGNLQVAEIGTFDGPVVWNGGEIGRAGGALAQQVILNGGLTMQGSAEKFLSFFGGFRMTNNGAATWSGTGAWTIGMIPGACCPAIFENAAGATFEVQNTASILQTAFGVGVIENAGTLTKTSAGISEWAVNLNNTGLVQVQSGELRLTRAGVIGGTWQIEPGAELGIAGNFFELEPGVVINGRAVVKQSGTNPGIVVNSEVTIDDLTIAADGRLGGTSTLKIAGTLTNEAGAPSVHIHILPGGHLESSGVAPFFGKLDVEGTAHLPAGANMGCFNQVLTILPGGVFTIDDGATLGQTGLLTQPIENHGTIRKPATAGTATILNAFNWYINNHADGTLSVEGGVTACPSRLENSGTIDIAAGAEFRQQSWATYYAGTTITGEGFYHVDHAANNIVDDGFELEIPRLRLSGNMNAGHGIGGNGNLAITQEFDLQGGRIYNPVVTIREGATMNVTGPDDVGPPFTGGHITFDNYGTTNIIAQDFHFAVFNNHPTGVVNIQGDFQFSRFFSGTVNNQGLLVKSAGAGDSPLLTALTNTGTVRVETGRMLFDTAIVQNAGLTELAGGDMQAPLLTLNGGILRGAGDLTASVTNNGGTIEPGASPGTLNILGNANPFIAGTYTQGAGGTLSIEVGGLTPGTQHDRLVVAGTANLNGTLELRQFGGFNPSPGQAITVLTAGSIIGNFSSVQPVGFAGCITASAQVVGNAVVVTFGAAGPDGDGDGTPDCVDACPADPNKIAPGVCGCGVSDADSDGDGAADCNDGCPSDPNKTAPGACGCGVADIDSDGDGVPDCNDVCPNNAPGLAVDGEGRPVLDDNGDCVVSPSEGPPQPAPSPVNPTPVQLCGMFSLAPLMASFAMLIGAKAVRSRRRRR